jgi:hypothetical protein
MKTRQTKIENLLPKTSDSVGGIYIQKIRCGRVRCRCAVGDLHQGFYYIRRIDGKRHKTYIARSAATLLGEMLRKEKESRRQKQARLNTANNVLSTMRQLLRGNEARIENLRNEE